MKKAFYLLTAIVIFASCKTSKDGTPQWKFGANPRPTKHYVTSAFVMVRSDGKFALKSDSNRIVYPDLRHTKRDYSLNDILKNN